MAIENKYLSYRKRTPKLFEADEMQDQPQEMGQVSSLEERKPNLFKRIFSEEAAPQRDVEITNPLTGEENIKRVEGYSGPSKFGRAMRYILPAMFGLAGGAGILPGMMVGLAGNRAQKQARKSYFDKNLGEAEKMGLESQKARADVIGDEASLAQKQKEADALAAYRKSQLGLGYENLNLKKKKAGLEDAPLNAWKTLSADDKNDLIHADPAKLQEYMGAPDEVLANAAKYIYDLKFKTRQLPKVEDEFSYDFAE